MSGHLFSKASKIPAVDAIRVQNEIIEKIHSYDNNLEILPIGSVGKKKEYNGDIDIAIKCKSFSDLYNVIHTALQFSDDNYKQLNNEILFVHSICYPYVSSEDNQEHFVQVDFMLIDNIDYAKFRYYCPNYINKESKYKVYARILFWFIILNNCDEKNVGLSKNEVGKFLFYPTGLYRSIINKNAFKESRMELFTQDPDKIISIAFKDGVELKNVLTVENLWNLIHSDKFKYPDKVKRIEFKLFEESYKKPWEELNINPGDFELQYWTVDEITTRLKRYDKMNEINMILYKSQER